MLTIAVSQIERVLAVTRRLEAQRASSGDARTDRVGPKTRPTRTAHTGQDHQRKRHDRRRLVAEVVLAVPVVVAMTSAS